MKEISINLKDISESREVMESKPFPMVIYFIYILLGFLLITFTWMYFSEIDIVVKGQGIIRPLDDVSIVKNKVTGRVKEEFLEEGKIVKKGDKLFVISYEGLNSNKELLEDQLAIEKNKLKNLIKYKESIYQKRNLFDKSNMEEKDYYEKYVGFSENIYSMNETLKLTTLKINQLINRKTLLNQLKKSIAADKNFIEEEGIYTLRFEEYQIRKREYDQEIKIANRTYQDNKLLYEQGAISKNSYEISQTKYEDLNLQLDKYVNQVKASINQELIDIDTSLQSLETEVNKLKGNLSQSEKQLPIETQEIISINEQIDIVKNKISSLEKNLKDTELYIEDNIIRAEKSGVIHLRNNISTGDYINASETIAHIIPESLNKYEVQISMPEREISNIERGDIIRYKFNALPYKEYGMLEGEVVNISEDSSFNQSKGKRTFIVTATVENKALYSYKGNKAELKNGMTCEAQVITKSKKVLYFLLEKIDLWG